MKPAESRQLDPRVAAEARQPWAGLLNRFAVIPAITLSEKNKVYGLEGAGGLAIELTRFSHSAGVIERSWGNSAAAITSLRTLVITTNSSAAFGLAASSSFAI